MAKPVNNNQVIKKELELKSQLLPCSVDVRSNDETHRHPETLCGAWSPDGRLFAWSVGNRTVVIVPCNEHGEPLTNQTSNYRRIHCNSEVRSLAFSRASPCRRRRKADLRYRRFHLAGHLVLAVGLYSGMIRPYDVCCLDNSQVGPLTDHVKPVTSLSFAPDESMLLVSSSIDGTCKVWDLHDDGNMGLQLSVPGCYSLLDVKWSPRSDCLAAVGTESTAVTWLLNDSHTKPEMVRLRGHQNTVSCCSFSPDGAYVVTGSHDTRLVVWNPYTGQPLLAPRSSSDSVLCHMSPPPGFIQAGGFNGHQVHSVCVSRDGLHLSSVCQDGRLRVWDLREPEEAVMSVHGGSEVMTFSHFSPVGLNLGVGQASGQVNFFEVPLEPAPLLQLCRLSVRQLVSGTRLNELFDEDKPLLPPTLRHFLSYQEI